MKKILELDELISQKSTRINELFSKETTKEDLEEIKRLTAEVEEAETEKAEIKSQEELKRRNDERMKSLSEGRKPAPTVPHPNGETHQPVTVKSIGEQFLESEEFKNWKERGGRPIFSANLDANPAVKATFTTSGATLTQFDRQPGMIEIGQQRLLIRDLLAMGNTQMNTIRFVKEDTFTNAATTVAEGATKPEASFDLSESDSPVRKIAVTAKVTDELFADFPALQSYIDNRLRFMVLQQEESQLLNGDGNAPNLTGLLNTSGILTQAKGADTAIDAIFKAMTKIRTTGFFEPDGMVINPTDWQGIRLSKDGNNQYMGGGPFTGAYGNGGGMAPDMLWGLRVVPTTAIAAGTALVGSYKLGAQFFLRQGLTVDTTNSNEDDFKKNLIAIRAEERGALAVYRPKAFCTVTGL